jgi:protein tyrosine/serine phosphatase
MSFQRNTVRVWFGTLVLALSVAASAAAATKGSGKLTSITIDNFGQVDDHYYRGAQPQGHDYANLSALGVKTVIDLTAEGEADTNEAGMVQSAGMKFVRIPMTTHDQPAPDAVARFLSLVNDPANQPVYVHCQGGQHRTGAMTAVYRMTHDGWTADRAFSEMEQYKFGPAFLHGTLKNFVYGYRPLTISAATATQTSRQ